MTKPCHAYLLPHLLLSWFTPSLSLTKPTAVASCLSSPPRLTTLMQSSQYKVSFLDANWSTMFLFFNSLLLPSRWCPYLVPTAGPELWFLSQLSAPPTHPFPSPFFLSCLPLLRNTCSSWKEQCYQSRIGHTCLVPLYPARVPHAFMATWAHDPFSSVFASTDPGT